MTEFRWIKPHTREIVSTVLGKDWDTKLKSGTKHSIPLPAGTEFEASLVTGTPFDIKTLVAAELKYGFKFRSILCGFMYLGLWTRPDIERKTYGRPGRRKPETTAEL
jgi:hypothetical protein